MDTPLALVAGASRGLGLLIARELLSRGHTVAICARDRDELDRAAELLAAHGPVTAYVCDVTSREDIADLVGKVQDELGPIEVLISVAGAIQVGPAESMTLEHFEEAIAVMLRGPIQLTWAVLPGMRQRRRGRIGTIASVGGTLAPPHLLPYAAAKFGAVGFSEGLTAELAGSGITSTTVIPGLLRTGSHERAMFTGDHGKEYAWFAPSASLPLLSMDAERAAAKIVDGVLRGRSHIVLTPLAKIGMRVHGIAPASTVAMLGLVNRLLPAAPDAPTSTLVGHQAQRVLDSSTVRALSTLGSRAARRFNERAS